MYVCTSIKLNSLVLVGSQGAENIHVHCKIKKTKKKEKDGHAAVFIAFMIVSGLWYFNFGLNISSLNTEKLTGGD